MCLGAIPWSGVKSVLCGATDADARGIGFDEGAKPRAWIKALAARGIEVVRGVDRRSAQKVLQDYAASGGIIY
jgi:tRNA(Arg) A34 adenosine deaminase TadA